MIPTAVTRSDYLYGNVTFAEYYGGIAEASDAKLFCRELEKRCRRSEDSHFNDVPLTAWDAIGRALGRNGRYQMALRVRRDTDTLATRVCVLKEAMRRLLRGP